jgi:hypothetical protein
VTALACELVPSLVAVTVAPATGAPLASVTVPPIEPVVDCAMAAVVQAIAIGPTLAE